MKLLLSTDLDAVVLPLYIQVDYLKLKGIPYWIYNCDYQERFCLKKSETDVSILTPYTFFLSTIDLGDRYALKDDEYRPKSIYQPYFKSMRFDEDLIRLIESNPEHYEEYMEVDEAPSGEKYRIRTSYDIQHEILDLESSISWDVAS